MCKKEKKNRLSQIKKLTSDLFSLTLEELESSEMHVLFRVLLRSFNGFVFIIRTSLSDCSCWLQVLIHSSQTMMDLTGPDTKKGKKERNHTYLCVFYVTTSEECVKATPALKEKVSTFVFFSSQKVLFFLGAGTVLFYFYMYM